MFTRFVLARVARVTAGTLVIVAANSCSSEDDGIGVTETCSVTSVTVTPGTGTAAVGATTTLVASVAASNCDPLPQIAWQSSAEHIATVSSTGVVTGVSPGSATITASAGGKSGTAAVTVRVAVANISLSAPGASVVIGSTIQANAQAKDANGNVLTGQQFAWTTSNNAVASVTQAGVIGGVAAGNVTITASADGKSATLNLTVTGAATLSITNITPASDAADRSVESTVQIQFSASLNANTVNAQSVSVATGGIAVPGTLAVNGNTVTFTPTSLLTEFRTTYTVTVTTAVQSQGANALPNTVTSNFTTAFWDTQYFYRLTNSFQAGKSMDIDGNQQCTFGDTGNVQSQSWFFLPTPLPGYYAMYNATQGTAKALEGADGIIACLMASPVGDGNFFTGQMWQPSAATSPGTYRLQNLALGATKSLGSPTINGTVRPGMTTTGNFTGQLWTFTRLAHR